MSRPTILLNPGPVTLTDRVRQSLLREDICHREHEFSELTLDLRQRLAAVYPHARERFETVLLTGSGTSGVEAMLASLLGAGSRALVATNGVYGERMAAMIRAHGRDAHILEQDWLLPIDLERVERSLAEDSSLTHVVAVHHETTTGRLNDVRALADVCANHGRRLLLDCVSSFGGEDIPFEHASLACVAATANKCMHGVPGVSFALVDPAELEGSAGPVPSVYLDLKRYLGMQRDGFSPFTQAIHAYFALQEALNEFDDLGGLEIRRNRYLHLSERVRAACAASGVQPLIPADESASMLRSYILPDGLDYSFLHDALRELGFVIYAGQGALSTRIFRVATMGDIRDADADRLVEGLTELLGL